MSKRLTGGILIGILAVFAGGTWLSCGEAGMEKGEYCGESFPIANVRFHVRKCPKNTTNHKMGPASGKTTVVK